MISESKLKFDLLIFQSDLISEFDAMITQLKLLHAQSNRIGSVEFDYFAVCCILFALNWSLIEFIGFISFSRICRKLCWKAFRLMIQNSKVMDIRAWPLFMLCLLFVIGSRLLWLPHRVRGGQCWLERLLIGEYQNNQVKSLWIIQFIKLLIDLNCYLL